MKAAQQIITGSGEFGNGKSYASSALSHMLIMPACSMQIKLKDGMRIRAGGIAENQ